MLKKVKAWLKKIPKQATAAALFRITKKVFSFVEFILTRFQKIANFGEFKDCWNFNEKYWCSLADKLFCHTLSDFFCDLIPSKYLKTGHP